MSAELIDSYRDQISKIVKSKRWVVAIDVLVAACHFAKELRDLGAQEIFLLSASRGSGDVDDSFPAINLKVSGQKGIMEGIHAAEHALQNLSEDVLQQLDSFDPEKKAIVLRTIFGSPHPVGGRKVFGAREERWCALEDKIIVDQLWDDAEIPRMPSGVVSLTDKDIWEQSQVFDRGSGTVWAGDNRDGWHGGASRIRYVNSREEAEKARIFLAQYCDHVRIMPFLEGIPCSIHGWVFPEEVVSFRPCEMLVLREDSSSSFVYCGVGTSWKPSQEIAQEMKDIAVKGGRYLQQKYDYRGNFTIDGVATKEGFFPTELNPRFGGAMGRIQHSIPSLPLYLLHLCVVEQIAMKHYPKDLERVIMTKVDENPFVKGMYIIPERFDMESRKTWISLEDQGWVFVDKDHPTACAVSIGPHSAGVILFVVIHPKLLAYGESGAKIFYSALRFLSSQWQFTLAKLVPAVDVTNGSVG